MLPNNCIYHVEGATSRLLPAYNELEDSDALPVYVERASIRKMQEITRSMEQLKKAHWYNGKSTKILRSKARALKSIDRLQLMMIHLVAVDM